ncbi:MAG: sigma-70 family RNA polymerase sigma factor [Planctomycetota bacterium]
MNEPCDAGHGAGGEGPQARPPRADDPATQLAATRWTEACARRLVRDRALAADLTQSTWALAVERFGREVVPEKRWLFDRLRALAWSTRRGERRRRAREADAARREALPSAGELVARAEARRRLAALVLELGEPARSTLLLHFQEGLSLAEIARREGAPHSTVHARAQRALAALRRRLEGEGADADALRGACLTLAAPLSIAAPPLPSSPAPPPWAPLLPPTEKATLMLEGARRVSVTALTLAVLGSIAVLVATALRSPAPKDPLGPGEATLAAAELEPEAPPPTLATVKSDGAARRDATAEASAPEPDPSALYRMRGQVVELEDAAVVGASVRLATGSRPPRARDEGGAPHAQALTGDDGRFELTLTARELRALEPFTAARLVVDAGPHRSEFSFELADESAARLPLPRAPGVDDIGVVRLEPAGAVFGRVIDEDGAPVAGERIRLLGPGSTEAETIGFAGFAGDAVTEPDGTFMLGHVSPGPALLEVYGERYFTAPERWLPVTIKLGETCGPVELVVDKERVVQGRVVDTSGAPCPGVHVNLSGNWSHEDTAETDGEGRFIAPVRRGAARPLETYHEGTVQVAPLPARLFRGGETAVEVVLRREAVAATLRVIDATSGEPLERFGARVLRGDAEASSARAPAPMTRPEGRFASTARPGLDRVSLAAPGYISAVVEVLARDDRSAPQVVALARRPGLTGVVTRDGRPVAGAPVRVASVWLRAASERLHLAGDTVERSPVDADPSARFDVQVFQPERVLGLDGPPPTHRWVRVFGSRGTLATRTDAEGRFRMGTLPSGRYAVTIDDGAGPTFEVAGVEFSADAGLDLGALDLPRSATLAGRVDIAGVLDASGLEAYVETLDRAAPVAANGAFLLADLPAGAVYITFRERAAAAERRILGEPPTCHVVLAPGEHRDVRVWLTPWRALGGD